MRTLILCFALAACPALAAAQAKPAPKAASAKPAPKAGPKPAAAASLNARDPASVAAFLTTVGAKTENTSANGLVTMRITTPGGGFGAQFVDCGPQGKTCAGVAFSTEFAMGSPTLAQLNLFNRDQFACRGYLGDGGKPSVMYATLLSSRTNADDMKQHLALWQGCLGAFGAFVRDPVGFLASN